jgi:glucuronosyltransferase
LFFVEDKFNAFKFAKAMPSLLNQIFIFGMSERTVDSMMKSDNVQSLLNSGEEFDAVVIELCAADALFGFGDRFNSPVIGVTTFDGVYFNDVYTANQSPYSYVPMMVAGLPDEMTFTQRLKNTVLSQLEKIFYNFYNLPKQRKLYQKYFPNAVNLFDDVHKNISLVFMNSHVSISSARPLMPNMIGIGGIHVQPPNPLPNDIQDFLDSATDGVILFSMGSFVLSTDWTLQQREAFVNVFGKLKQKVLWKYENETLPGNPGNIKIGKWIPQRDIMAHPNVKLFITHGGQLGTTEALSEGVPILGIPIFGDQSMNVHKAVSKGYALSLDFEQITEENFGSALNELLTNPKYEKNAKKFENIFSDRPMNPRETVVYWTEHVIRQEGADHLKAVGRNLSFIEFHLIDVYATQISGVFVFLLTVLKIFKMIWILQGHSH